MRAALALVTILVLACSGTAPNKPPASGGSGGDEDTGGSGGAGGGGGTGGGKPARDAAASTHASPDPEPDPDAGEAAADAPVVVTPGKPGPDTTVMGFSGTEVSFAAGTGNNKRIVDAPVKFPEASLLYKSVTLKLNLRCPAGGCDIWDRRAFLGVVKKDGDKESVTEILRFITPYKLTASWTIDVTALRPLLAGDVTLRVFIDTWVGPTSGAQGTGWLVDASFDFVGGIPARVPIAVIPLWDEMHYDYGDPAKPVDDAVPLRTVTIPAGAGAVELRSFITGHGQGNLDNCAEFCQRTHAFLVGNTQIDKMIWRQDCGTTAVPNQPGTYRTPRSGWCPGADVKPWVADVTAAAPAGQPVTIAYGVQPYENTCRPDAPMCGGCALRTGCAYDNGAHTTPFFELSAALIVYAK